MTFDDKIEQVLSDFYKSENGIISIPDYIYSKFENSNDLSNQKECDLIVKTLLQNALIGTENNYNYFLEPKGKNIVESGGWIQHLTTLANERAEDEKNALIQSENVYWQAKLAKVKYKTYKTWFLLFIVGSTLGIISFVFQLISILKIGFK